MNENRTEFPLYEKHRSADGREVEFVITAHEFPTCYLVNAEETPASRGHRHGYRFSAHSPTAPWLALAEIRRKIRKNLAVRFLDDSDGQLLPTHDRLMCRVDFSKETKEVVLEVDGRRVTREEFWRIVSAHEGFEIEIRFLET
jgi:hypothetical protein